MLALYSISFILSTLKVVFFFDIIKCVISIIFSKEPIRDWCKKKKKNYTHHLKTSNTDDLFRLLSSIFTNCFFRGFSQSNIHMISDNEKSIPRKSGHGWTSENTSLENTQRNAGRELRLRNCLLSREEKKKHPGREIIWQSSSRSLMLNLIRVYSLQNKALRLCNMEVEAACTQRGRQRFIGF